MKYLSSFVDGDIIGDDVMISSIALDSRHVTKGSLFFAVRGSTLDGHDYIKKAVDNGAVAIILEDKAHIEDTSVSYVLHPMLSDNLGLIAAKFFDVPSASMNVIGITGTNGKTSVCSYIQQLHEKLNICCGAIGTLGVSYGDQFFESINTTPDAVSLQGYYKNMLDLGVSTAVMEVSSHAINQQRVRGVEFNTAIFTNISHEHLDYHGSFAHYLRTKTKLFETPGLALAVINIDDESSDSIIANIADDVRVLTYSLRNHCADIYFSDITRDANTYHCALNYFGESHHLTTQLIGEFNLYNVLASLASLSMSGHSINKILEHVAEISDVTGRMQLVKNDRSIKAIVDYAHTPDALSNVLAELHKDSYGKLVLVFGCGGQRDKEKRAMMAAVAEQFADVVIVTNDNPRFENPLEIIEDICKGFSLIEPVLEPDREAAISTAVLHANAGDIVLVAGKGHENYQLIADKTLPFSDVDVLSAVLSSQVGQC